MTDLQQREQTQPAEVKEQPPSQVRDGGEPNDPAEGEDVDDQNASQNDKLPSTHVPDTRSFDL